MKVISKIGSGQFGESTGKTLRCGEWHALPPSRRGEAGEAQKSLAPPTESISVHPISAGRSSD
jgi:hypothetical protein